MVTQLSTVKARLAITVTDFDGILTNAIKAVSTRFDKETNRTPARTENHQTRFPAPRDTVRSDPSGHINLGRLCS